MATLLHVYPIYSGSSAFTSSYTGSDGSIIIDENIGLYTASLLELYIQNQLSNTFVKSNLQRMSSDNTEYYTSRQTKATIDTQKLQRSVFVDKSNIGLGDNIFYMFRGKNTSNDRINWNSYDFNYEPSNLQAGTKEYIGEYVSLTKNGNELSSYGNLRSGSMDPYQASYTSSLETVEYGTIYFQQANVAGGSVIIEEWQQRAEDLNTTDKTYWRSTDQITTSPPSGYVKNNTVENVETIYRK
jgi:hypothetical protein